MNVIEFTIYSAPFLPHDDYCRMGNAANRLETGGLSGPPLKPYTLTTLRTLRALLPESIPLIGCGGISSGADALEYARAGAVAVQVYTRFAYEGVGTCRRIKDEITAALAKENTTWAEVVRVAVAENALRDSAVGGVGSLGSPGEGVEQLRREAEELVRLADELGKRMDSEAGSGESLSLARQAVSADDASKAVLPSVS